MIRKWIVGPTATFDLDNGSYILIILTVNHTNPSNGGVAFFGGNYWPNSQYNKMTYYNIAGTDYSNRITTTLNSNHTSYNISVEFANTWLFFFN